MERNNVISEMGFEMKESSQNENRQSEVEQAGVIANENNSAEKTLKTIATITLVLGIIAAFVMVFTVCFVPKYGDNGQNVFNPIGFGMTVGVLLSCIISWATLNVFANISLTLKDIKSKISK